MRRIPESERRATCPGCGHEFVRPPKHRRQRFCSHACGRKRGAENNKFNGGLCRRADGRWVIWCRDGSLLYFYRGMLAAHIGRLLTSQEIVHHINGDPSDDRIENLEIVTRAEHMNMHRAELMAGRP